jgi:hypothetical protein
MTMGKALPTVRTTRINARNRPSVPWRGLPIDGTPRP